MKTSEAEAWAPKYTAKALLGYILDSLLCGAPPDLGDTAVVPSPWDAWWACYRAGLPTGTAGVRVRPGDACADCDELAAVLAAASPPGHPGTAGPGPCGCLLRWAAAMRAPGPPADWPPVVLSLALIKPCAPAGRVLGMLGASHEVVTARELVLTTADTRRLYPEAYGADYVAERDAYLTSGPVRVLVLRARHPAVTAGDVKAAIRAEVGGDALRNHLHMPDNPGEALADIAHFVGRAQLASLHRRFERDHVSARLAFYRAALGISQPRADRLSAAR